MQALIERPKMKQKVFHRRASSEPSELNASSTLEGSSEYNVQSGLNFCACDGGCPRCAGVQTKLRVSAPGDRDEMEADRVADRVMRMGEPTQHRHCTCGGTCPQCSGKDVGPGHLNTHNLHPDQPRNAFRPSVRNQAPAFLHRSNVFRQTLDEPTLRVPPAQSPRLQVDRLRLDEALQQFSRLLELQGRRGSRQAGEALPQAPADCVPRMVCPPDRLAENLPCHADLCGPTVELWPGAYRQSPYPHDPNVPRRDAPPPPFVCFQHYYNGWVVCSPYDPTGQSGLGRALTPSPPEGYVPLPNLGSGLTLQPKLTLSTPGDRYEQQADRTADQLVRIREDQGQTVMVHRPAGGGQLVPPLVAQVVSSSGHPLDSATRSFMEPRFGHDFSRVRVHTDARASQSAQRINASAYTVGSDIAFASGQYTPSSTRGRWLLAHELTHVIQQSGPFAGAGIQPTERKIQRQNVPSHQWRFNLISLRAYLKLIRRQGHPVGYGPTRRDTTSDDYAQEIVERWLAGDPAFSDLDVYTRILLIRELNIGTTPAVEQRAILNILRESLPSERQAILDAINQEIVWFQTRLEYEMVGAQQEAYDNLLTTHRLVRQLSAPWAVWRVRQIFERHGDDRVLRDIIRRHIRIVRFQRAVDEWTRNDPTNPEVREFPAPISADYCSPRHDPFGNCPRGQTIIFLADDLTDERAAYLLYQQYQRIRGGGRQRQEREVDRFSRRHGLPPLISVPSDRSGWRQTGRRFEERLQVTGWQPSTVPQNLPSFPFDINELID